MRSFGTIRLKSRSSLNDRLVLEGVAFKNLLLAETAAIFAIGLIIYELRV